MTWDKFINGIEGKVLEEKVVKLFHKEMLDLFLKFQDVCNDLNQEWEVYKEIDKQAKLPAEYNQAHGVVDETSKLVSE